MSENGNSTRLTPKQETLIQALVAGHTIQLSAKAAGISEQTAHRWRKLPYFQTAYKAAQRQVYDQSLQRLLLRIDLAIDRLTYHLDSSDTPAHSQIRAAQIILERLDVHVKQEELEQRLSSLEALEREEREQRAKDE